jgi:hypothetical protein
MMAFSHSQKNLVAIPVFVLVFLVCGMGSLFCPMPSFAGEAPHSQPVSHHPTSHDGNCPDQLKNSEEESRPFSFDILDFVELEKLGSGPDLFKLSLSKVFIQEGSLTPSSYPPLFLLFSSLLN